MFSFNKISWTYINFWSVVLLIVIQFHQVHSGGLEKVLPYFFEKLEDNIIAIQWIFKKQTTFMRQKTHIFNIIRKKSILTLKDSVVFPVKLMNDLRCDVYIYILEPVLFCTLEAGTWSQNDCKYKSVDNYPVYTLR